MKKCKLDSYHPLFSGYWCDNKSLIFCLTYDSGFAKPPAPQTKSYLQNWLQSQTVDLFMNEIYFMYIYLEFYCFVRIQPYFLLEQSSTFACNRLSVVFLYVTPFKISLDKPFCEPCAFYTFFLTIVFLD